MEYIGEKCFSGSCIEEIVLPSTLKDVGEDIFTKCHSLRAVWVGEGCTLDIAKCVEHSVAILPAGMMVGDTSLSDLRA